jgi:DnaJ-class molecular chaperone
LGENRGKEKLHATEEPSKCKHCSGKGSVDGVDPNKLCDSEGGPGGWQFQQREM